MSKPDSDRLKLRSFREQNLEDCCSLLLSAARGLHENGQATGESLEAIARLGTALDVKVSLFPTWGELFVQVSSTQGTVLRAIAATPANVSMNRVTTTLRTIEAICEGRIAGAEAKKALAAANRKPPSNLYLFILACSAGAGALALIFGAMHPQAIALIAFSAALGALLRRTYRDPKGCCFHNEFSAGSNLLQRHDCAPDRHDYDLGSGSSNARVFSPKP